MKAKSLFFHAIVLSTFIIMNGCKESPTQLYPPKCVITAPFDGSFFTVNDTLVILAEISDIDGSIGGIEILLNESVIEIPDSPTFEYVYNTGELDPGAYILKVKAIDSDGLEASDEIQITVNPALELFTDSREGNLYNPKGVRLPRRKQLGTELASSA